MSSMYLYLVNSFLCLKTPELVLIWGRAPSVFSARSFVSLYVHE